MKTRLNAGKNRLSKCKQSVEPPQPPVASPCQIQEGKLEVKQSTVTTRVTRGSATPKNKIRKVQRAITNTPGGRDDLLCSQHFDSQVVVGWDCQSPDTLRGIKRFSGSEKTDEVTDLLSKLIEGESDIEELPKINTPPLLGVWRENKITRLQDNDTGIQRLRKRSHLRKKKESDVSRDLLKNLTRALDKCSEDGDCEEKEEKLDENIDTRDDTCLTVLTDPTAVNSNVSTVTYAVSDKNNESGRLSTEKVDNTELDEVNGDNVDVSDETWSDDDLFDEDSFIVKATQIPVNNNIKFSPPLLGNKRKSSCDNIAPKCKTSRYSFQLGNENEDVRSKPIDNNGTDLNCKKNFNLNVVSNSSNVSNIGSSTYNVTKPLSKKPPVFPTSVNTSLAFSNLKTSSVQSHLINQNVSINSNFNRKSSTVTSSSLNNQYRSSPVVNVSSFAQNIPKQPSSSISKPFTSSIYQSKTSSVSNNIPSSSSAANSSKFSFKKHNSFSGPDVLCSDPSSRRRSVSGGNSSTMPNKPYINNNWKPTVNGSSGSVNNRNLSNTSTTTIVNQSKPVFPPKSSTLSSVCKTSSINSSNKIINKQGNENKSVVPSPPTFSPSGLEGFYKKNLNDSGFDTSISDDLLCQLAEPDDVLDNVVIDTTVCGQPGSDTVVKSDGSSVKNEHVSTNNVKASTSNIKVNSSSNSCAMKTSDTKINTVNHKVVDKETKDMSAISNDWGMNSEDLFASDDDYDDDGLTEPEVLAMLDEVELLATQQIAHERQLSSSQGNKKQSPTKIQAQTDTSCCELKDSQESNSQNKYSQADIEKKKQEAIARRKMKMKR